METQSPTTAPALKGIWTPWAAIFCYACHGPELRGRNKTIPADDFKALCQPAPRYEGSGLGQCDKCHEPVQIDADLAVLQQTKILLTDGDGPYADFDVTASMQQTGGMCSALQVEAEGYRTAFMTNLDGPVFITIFEWADWVAYQETGYWPEGEANRFEELAEGTPIAEFAEFIAKNLTKGA